LPDVLLILTTGRIGSPQDDRPGRTVSENR
jgi:hypothetical protein